MRLWLTWMMLMSVLLVSQVDAEEKQQASTEDEKPFLVVKLVDEQGKPVVGAQTGMVAIVKGSDREQGLEWDFGHYEQKSDAEGMLRFRDRGQFRSMVYARHAGRGLVAVKRTDLIQDQKSPLVLTMYPECHVTWTIESSQLRQRGKEIGVLRGLSSSENLICQWCQRTGSTLHFFLPQGEFSLLAHSKHISPIEKAIEIKAGQKTLDAGTSDAHAQKWILLEGQPAPEIADVKEWKNSPPIKLSQLRGKVVVLEFWGWWCGPCVYFGIPELFKLRDEYSQDDLAIIGIHTPYGEEDEVTSVAEMDQKLAKIREKIWKGKTIEFPVALTRFRKVPYYPGEKSSANAIMNVEYGINRFPSSIVIDRQGNVVGKLDLRDKAGREELRKLIEAK
ncbi:Thiol-disulfide oxidoreductase ResA [Gimesia panareensis]|uniref:Thiol-disulfide oxidoreductase ResA n=1 Tax=Gimesia panareensis TaxID=2527978 RepID=A0A518FHZ8_9PLAN|nr:TlpA disulfide reductase family protein [Gimesia panareensis]QDV15961.1 Thiol-disulfide oxidoreductase ResA [Gimesia panareensis]